MTTADSDEKYNRACEEARVQIQQTQKPLLDEYRRKFKEMTSRERALMEATLWKSLDKDLRRAINHRDKESAKWLFRLLKNGEDSPMGIRSRARTLNSEQEGNDVSAVWVYLDDGSNTARDVRSAFMYANSKVAILRMHHIRMGLDEESAKKLQQDKFKEALFDFLTSPDKQVLEDTARSAKMEAKGRSQPSVRAPQPPPAERPTVKPEPEPEPEADGDSPDRDGGIEAKELWNTIQDFVNEKAGDFARRRLEGIETNVLIDERLSVLHREMQACFQDFLLGVRQARTRSKDLLEVRREKLRWALEVLRVDIPRRNWRKEHIDKQLVKKQYRTLSARFHPDSHQGDTRYVARYGDVQEAYQLLKSALNL